MSIHVLDLDDSIHILSIISYTVVWVPCGGCVVVRTRARRGDIVHCPTVGWGHSVVMMMRMMRMSMMELWWSWSLMYWNWNWSWYLLRPTQRDVESIVPNDNPK